MRSWPCLLITLSAFPALAADPIVGGAAVTDGDTLVIRETRIRLHGIDAPESAQTCKDATGKDYRCGQAAALAFAEHIGKRVVTCEPRDTDRYGRVVAVCRADADDLNAWMVQEGHAIVYRRYAEDYVNAELTAKALQRGSGPAHSRTRPIGDARNEPAVSTPGPRPSRRRARRAAATSRATSRPAASGSTICPARVITSGPR